jgi:MFS family permease
VAADAPAARPARSVLEDLDSRIPTNFYWYLAVLACIGGFLFGYDTSNIGSSLGFIPYHLSSFATGYLVAGASLGAAAGALFAGPLTDRFGRKILLVTDAAIYAAGSILSAVTVNAGMLLASRTLIGLAIGADSAIATAYIAEFAPRARRGQLSIIQQWMITVGILVAYVVAVIILKAAPGSASSSDWRLILGLGGVPALVAVALRSHMPESPRWLMLNGRYDETRKAFARLGMDVTDDEVRSAADQARGEERRSRAKSQWTKGVRRALAVVCVFFIFQQVSGINVPFYYGPAILGPYFGNGRDAVGAARAAATAACVDWLANYALIEAFPAWRNSIGLGWVMVCFAVLCVAAIAFVYHFLPETKGLSVEQTVRVFEEQAGADTASADP